MKETTGANIVHEVVSDITYTKFPEQISTYAWMKDHLAISYYMRTLNLLMNAFGEISQATRDFDLENTCLESMPDSCSLSNLLMMCDRS